MKRFLYLSLFLFIAIPAFYSCGDKDKDNEDIQPIITVDNYVGTWEEQFTSMDTLWVSVPEILPYAMPITQQDISEILSSILDTLDPEDLEGLEDFGDLEDLKNLRDTVNVKKESSNKISLTSVSGKNQTASVSGASLTFDQISISEAEMKALGFDINSILSTIDGIQGITVSSYQLNLGGNGQMINNKINLTYDLSVSIYLEIAAEIQESMGIPVSELSVNLKVKLNSTLTK